MAFTHPAQAEEHFSSKNHKKKMSKLDKPDLGFDLLPEDEPYVTRYCKQLCFTLKMCPSYFG